MRDGRIHPRYACCLPCRLVTEKGEFGASVLNVSVGGLYLESLVRMEKGGRVEIQIEGLAGKPLLVSVEVVHWRVIDPESDPSSIGYGVRVEKLHPDYLNLVAQLAEAGHCPLVD